MRPAVAFALALAVVAPGLVGIEASAAEADADCRTPGDAGLRSEARPLDVPLSCRGALSGEDRADWYSFEATPASGLVTVTLASPPGSDFDLCWERPAGGYSCSALAVGLDTRTYDFSQPGAASGTVLVEVLRAAGAGKYVLTVATADARLQVVSGTIRDTAPAPLASPVLVGVDAAAGVASGPCIPDSPAGAERCEAGVDAVVADPCVGRPLIEPDLCPFEEFDVPTCLRSVLGVPVERCRNATLAEESSPLTRSAGENATRTVDQRDGALVRLLPVPKGREWVTLAFVPERGLFATSAPEVDLEFRAGSRVLGSCADAGFEECRAPAGADRVLLLARGLPAEPAKDAARFQLAYDVRARVPADCAAAADAADSFEAAVPIAAGLSCLGSVGGEDVADWFRIALGHGDRLLVRLEVGAEADADVCVFSPGRHRLACGIEPAGEAEAVEVLADGPGEYRIVVQPATAATYLLTVTVAGPPTEAEDCLLSADGGDTFELAVNVTKDLPLVQCVAHLGGTDRHDWFSFYLPSEGGFVDEARVPVPVFVRVAATLGGVDACLVDPDGVLLGCGVGDEDLVVRISRCVRGRGEFRVVVTSPGAVGAYDLTIGAGAGAAAATKTASDAATRSLQLLCGTIRAGTDPGSAGGEVDLGPPCPTGTGLDAGVNGCLGADRRFENRTGDGTDVAFAPEPVDGFWVRLATVTGADDYYATSGADGVNVTFYNASAGPDDEPQPRGPVPAEPCAPDQECRTPPGASFAYLRASAGTRAEVAFSVRFVAAVESTKPTQPPSSGGGGGGAGVGLCGPQVMATQAMFVSVTSLSNGGC